jgi:enoyl-[acyl-carrier-protein] reductase (NADH)
MIFELLKKIHADGDIQKMIGILNHLCPMKKMGDAWDIAYAALFLASKLSGYVTGDRILVGGGSPSRMKYDVKK